MDSEDLQGCLLKFCKDSKIFRISAETFYDWIENKSLPWAAYRVFMPGSMIALDKQPGVRPVKVGETWRHIFAKIVLKTTGLEATMPCQDKQLCAGIKAGIGGEVHRGMVRPAYRGRGARVTSGNDLLQYRQTPTYKHFKE